MGYLSENAKMVSDGIMKLPEQERQDGAGDGSRQAANAGASVWMQYITYSSFSNLNY
jgi:hypothetical protein